MIKIRDNIWLGDCEDSNDPEKMKDFTGILNVAWGVHDKFYNPRMIDYIHVGLVDDAYTNPYNYLTKLAVTCLKQMVEKGKKVFVHCAAGQSRSPMIIALAINELENKPILEVYKELIKLVPNIKDSLMYNKIFKEEMKKDE